MYSISTVQVLKVQYRHCRGGETVTEFARERNTEPQTVTHYMSRHGLEYDRSKGLTEAQEQYLSEQYPLPKEEVVRVIEDTESLRKYTEAVEKIAELEAEKGKLTAQVARLELMEEQRESLIETNKEQSEELEQMRIDKALAEQEQERLKQELERIQNRNLLQRIFNL